MRHREDKWEDRSNKRFIFGVILIAVGVILILQKLNLIPWDLADLLISWQMLLIAIGAISLAGGNRTGGAILILLGAFFLVPEIIHIPHEILKIKWPLVLVIIGLVLLLRNRTTFREVHDQNQTLFTGSNSTTINSFDDFVIFGGRELFITSQSLVGGKATAIFGGIEYDLRQAKLSPNGAVIDCASVFGGCGFKIPMDWNVRNEVTTVFGAFSDKRGPNYNQTYFDPAKTLVIKGVSIFGGVEIKHF